MIVVAVVVAVSVLSFYLGCRWGRRCRGCGDSWTWPLCDECAMGDDL